MSNGNGFIFYPNDWLADDKLSLCSPITKGAWIDLICWMHKNDQRGFLIVNKKRLNKKDIQRLLKMNDDDFRIVWNELNEFGVISLHENGAYYSKRVVNDFRKAVPRSGISDEESELIDKVVVEFSRVVGSKVKFNEDRAKDLIALRIKDEEGKLSFSDFSDIIKLKHEQWWSQDIMRSYVRPEIIFGSKFPLYLDEVRSNENRVDPNIKRSVGYDYQDM